MKWLKIYLTFAFAIMAASYAFAAVPKKPKPKQQILITNVNVFDGKSDKLANGMSVLVEGNLIKKVSKSIKAPSGARVIDGSGRTLTPGFIDMHAHLMFQMPFGVAFSSDREYYAYVATRSSRQYLMQGFTTVRDVGGNSFSLKKAIDQGVVLGPRVYPSGPMISQISGHSDMRSDAQSPVTIAKEQSVPEKYFHAALADGRDEVLRTVREVLRRGASQVKISVGGGTGSQADPLDTTQYTADEIRAAVEAAKDWNTYVTAHVYNSAGIIRAVENGVKCIEHGNLMGEAAMKAMMKHDAWLSPQVIVYTFHPAGYTDDQKAKHDEAFSGIDQMFKLARKLGFKNIVFGTDVITSPAMLARANEEFTLRTKWFSNAEILKQATSNSAKLLSLSGPRNPYPGKLGVIEEGALADLLLIDGNPLKDIKVLEQYEDRFNLIMKDGKIHKNTIN